ncbi:MAG: hypothetical protein ACTSWY_04165 [Promethearchaeota archaeon]
MCNASNFLYIPKENILGSKKGLLTCFVHSGLVCEHSFQVFVDKNGKVRGHETPDFELKFTPEEIEPEKKGERQDFEEKGRLLILRALLGEEIFIKTLRSAFFNYKLIIITENEIIRNQLKPYFEQIFGIYSPDISIVTLKDYNENIRKRIYGSKHKKELFVFNPDLTLIIKDQFDKKFKIAKYKLEKSLLDLIDIKQQKDSEIIEILKTSIDQIYETCKEIIDLVNHRKIKDEKELSKKLKKSLGKKIECSNETIKQILVNHFSYNVVFIDDRAIRSSGYKY